MNTFGQNIVKVRINKRMKQKDLQKRLACHSATSLL